MTEDFRNPTPEEHRASEAKRILEEVTPYFDRLEKVAIEEMLLLKNHEADTAIKRNCLADRISVLRLVKRMLHEEIKAGRPKPDLKNRVA